MLARKGGSRTRKKLIFMFLAVVGVMIALACRITYINASEGEKYSRIVMSQEQQQYESRTIKCRRGDITDRNGTILATSEKVYNVILDCKVVNTEVEELDGTKDQKYLEPTVKALVSVLGLNEAEIRQKLTDDETKNSQYVILKKGISIDDKQKFEAYTDTTGDDFGKLSADEQKARENVKGVWFEEDYVRTYPLKSLACDTIGFTYDGTTADWGIEGYYSDLLNGTDLLPTAATWCLRSMRTCSRLSGMRWRTLKMRWPPMTTRPTARSTSAWWRWIRIPGKFWAWIPTAGMILIIPAISHSFTRRRK